MELLEGETLQARAQARGRAPARAARCWCSPRTSATCSRRPTRRASSTATSSRRTSSSRPIASSRCSTSASPAAATRPGSTASRRRARRWARPPSCRRSRPSAAAATSTPDPTSGAWARRCSRCSRGSIVHEAETQGELLAAAATRPARSLAEVAPDVPAPIVALVDRALRFARDERWPSARGLPRRDRRGAPRGLRRARLAGRGGPGAGAAPLRVSMPRGGALRLAVTPAGHAPPDPSPHARERAYAARRRQRSPRRRRSRVAEPRSRERARPERRPRRRSPVPAPRLEQPSQRRGAALAVVLAIVVASRSW